MDEQGQPETPAPATPAQESAGEYQLDYTEADYAGLTFPQVDGAYGWSEAKRAEFVRHVQHLQLHPVEAQTMVDYYARHMNTAYAEYTESEQRKAAQALIDAHRAEERFEELKARYLRQERLSDAEREEMLEGYRKFHRPPAGMRISVGNTDLRRG